MIVSILWFVLIFLPAVFFHLSQMVLTLIDYQIAALLYPSKLQFDTVDDSEFLIGIPEIVKAAMQRLYFLSSVMVAWSALSTYTSLANPHSLRHCSRKPTNLTAVSLGAIGFPGPVVIHLFFQGDESPVYCDSLEDKGNCIWGLTGVGRIDSASEFLPSDPPCSHFCLHPCGCHHMLLPVEIRKISPDAFPLSP